MSPHELRNLLLHRDRTAEMFPDFDPNDDEQRP